MPLLMPCFTLRAADIFFSLRCLRRFRRRLSFAIAFLPCRHDADAADAADARFF